MEQIQGNNAAGQAVPVPSIPLDVILPEVQPPEGHVGRFTNQLNFIRYQVFESMSKVRGVEVFRNPVNPSIVTNYYTFVKRPMDLGTIRKRILNKFYFSYQECLRDFQQMFANAYLYNHPRSDMVQTAQRLELFLLRELMDMPTEEVEIESLGRYPLTAAALHQDAEETPKRHSQRLQLKQEQVDPSSDDSDSNSDDDPQERMFPLKLFQEHQGVQAAFLSKQMDLMKKQMDHLHSMNLTPTLNKGPSSSTTQAGVPLPKKGQPQRKKRKVDVASAKSALPSTSSSKTPNEMKSTTPKPDPSKPMTQEETKQLEEDIFSLFSEDRDEVIDKMEPYITQEDVDKCEGRLPLMKCPPHCQWEMREMVEEKLRTTEKFAAATPP